MSDYFKNEEFKKHVKLSRFMFFGNLVIIALAISMIMNISSFTNIKGLNLFEVYPEMRVLALISALIPITCQIFIGMAYFYPTNYPRALFSRTKSTIAVSLILLAMAIMPFVLYLIVDKINGFEKIAWSFGLWGMAQGFFAMFGVGLAATSSKEEVKK